MTWKIEFDDSASKEFKKLDLSSQKVISRYLRDRVLGTKHPQDLGKPMKYGYVGLWRYRVDKFHIICKIEDSALVVLVLKIVMRDNVYN